MEINQLFYFRSLYKEGSFAKAAVFCSVSQPSLSLQIKKLEEELGEQLVIRSRKGCRLTSAGEIFWVQAQRILFLWEETLQLFDERSELHKKVIRIGAIPTIAPYLIPQKIAKIRELVPDINIDISEDKTADMIDKVMSEEVDFGICSNIPSLPSGLQLEPLYLDPLHVILPKNEQSLLIKKMDDLDLEKLILLKEGHCLSDQTVSQCKAIDLRTTGSVRCENIETLVGLVESEMGYGIIPEMALANYGKRGIYIPEIKSSNLVREINIISKVEKLFDPSERLVIKALVS